MEKQNKKHIVFILPSLGFGGAEKFFVRLILEIYQDYKITVICLTNGGSLLKDIENKVNKIYILSTKNKLTLKALVELKSLLNEHFENHSRGELYSLLGRTKRNTIEENQIFQRFFLAI